MQRRTYKYYLKLFKRLKKRKKKSIEEKTPLVIQQVTSKHTESQRKPTKKKENSSLRPDSAKPSQKSSKSSTRIPTSKPDETNKSPREMTKDETHGATKPAPNRSESPKKFIKKSQHKPSKTPKSDLIEKRRENIKSPKPVGKKHENKNKYPESAPSEERDKKSETSKDIQQQNKIPEKRTATKKDKSPKPQKSPKRSPRKDLKDDDAIEGPSRGVPLKKRQEINKSPTKTPSREQNKLSSSKPKQTDYGNEIGDYEEEPFPEFEQFDKNKSRKKQKDFNKQTELSRKDAKTTPKDKESEIHERREAKKLGDKQSGKSPKAHAKIYKDQATDTSDNMTPPSQKPTDDEGFQPKPPSSGIKFEKKAQKPSKINKTKSKRPAPIPYKVLETSDPETEEDDEDAAPDLDRKESVHLPKLHPKEAEFLELVSANDVAGARDYLDEHPSFNVNCTTFQGVSPLHIAVQNRSEDMVDLLLEQHGIDIADTVLHAVRDNNLKILVKLLDAQKRKSPGLEFAGATHSTEFPEHVTPLILAAQCGNYEAVALLVARGHTIEQPHAPNCACDDCKRSLATDDPLNASSGRLSVYRAVASPAYLVHMASDPILTAFRLSAELAANASAYRQFASAYLTLQAEVSAFPVDLISCCRTSEEVEIMLKQTSGSQGRRHFVLPRLLMAVDYKQKEFVAHPNTQQVLESYWCGNWYSWRTKRSLTKALIILLRVFITPLILLLCLIVPRSSLVRHWQIPLNKLITHAAAYFLFLLLVFIVSNRNKTDQTRGPPNTGAEPFVVIYVIGFAWSTIRMCVMQGPKRYFTELWNWGEIIMILLYMTSFALWMRSASAMDSEDAATEERKYWNQYDPTLLAEGFFCLATIFAYFRLMFLCQLNYHLGPLQVSLGKMTIDIYKYTIVFAIIISAFAAALARFYQYYDGMVYEDEFGMKTVQVSSFTSLADTLNTLFWALFCMAPLESADVVIENLHDPKNPEKDIENRHSFTERVGYLCFGCFEVVSVIVVLNMLIATMSNTFQRVNDNVAIEWTFGRTEVYVDYMSQTTLPSPYNLIPTASGVRSVFEWCGVAVRHPPGVYARCSLSYCCYIERDVEANLEKEYPALISALVQRYFRDKEAASNNNGIETELEALRREITALRVTIENNEKEDTESSESRKSAKSIKSTESTKSN